MGKHPARKALRRWMLVAVTSMLVVPALIAPGASADTARFREYPVPNVASDLTRGSDGNLWFTERSGVGRLTPAGQVTDFVLPEGGSVSRITAGPDGKLWFTESVLRNEMDHPRIGTIDPLTEKITHYGLSSSAWGCPEGITAGPDGNVWFIDLCRNRIGRITPAGVVTGFKVPNAWSLADITAGPDGNLWITTADSIVKMTTTGVFTVFPIPLVDDPAVFRYAGAGEITLGPDGNLWFTEVSVNRIGRITPTGTITQFLIPTADS
ncbi:MAG: hypothetical protein LC749_21425, partial [Actinobacteria bacterium]|nr:hypothetical protein [Actinomycetota bacterium]